MGNVDAIGLPEWAAWKEAETRAQVVKARLAEIVHTLPDAGEKERTALLKEQAALVAESQTLPATVGELARRYALAHLAYLEAEYIQLDAKFAEVDAKLDALKDRGKVLQKAQADNARVSTHNTARLDAEGERALQERRDAQTAEAVRIGKECARLDWEAKPIETEWYRVKGERGAQVARAKGLYGVAFLLNHSDWQRCAHVFGETQRRQADHELHGNFDSLAGPIGVRARMPMPRSKALPLP